MWPFNGGSTSNTTTNINNNNNNDLSGVPPSRSSSSTCSSPSANESSSTRKSMEEVWNDINLPSLVQDQTQLTTHKHNHPFTLQDFISRSFKDQPTITTTTTTSTGAFSLIDPFDSLAGTLTPLTPLPPHPPATILSLNSPGADHPMPSSRPQLLHSHFSIGDTAFGSSSSLNSAFDPFGSSPVLPSFKKRAYENGEESGDRRRKRMMKNRESASRSRARKQAYRNELEHEVKRLLKENAKLKDQQQRFLAAATQLPKKRTLYRTLTAPF